MFLNASILRLHNNNAFRLAIAAQNRFVSTVKSIESIRNVDFQNCEGVFSSKSTSELLRAYAVFHLCSKQFLVKRNDQIFRQLKSFLGDSLFQKLLKSTVYGHFVGGEDEESLKPLIERLRQANIGAILDYAVEADVSTSDAVKAEMSGSTSYSGDNVDVTDVRFKPSEKFGDRRKGVHSARTYFYDDEIQCDKNVEIFKKCIEVAGACSENGFAAMKITALGRPQFLLQLSALLIQVREYYDAMSGVFPHDVMRRRVDKDHFTQHLQGLGVPVSRDDVGEWFTWLDTQKDGRSPYAKFRKLDILDNKVMAQYIWIDGTGQNLRSKTKTIECGPGDVQIDDCPDWNFDGANTDQAYGPETDCWLRPAAVFRDPFRGGNNKLVLCEVYNTDWRPDQRNHRGSCLDVMNLPEVEAAEPWFGMRQVYSIFDKSSAPHSVFSLEHPSLSSNYYCGVGYNRSYLRSLIESHYKACLFAGVNIAGANDEFVPSQKEFQIGPCRGIDMGDHLWIARYILQRVSEEFGVVISFDMHSQTGNSMGAHCHTNFSTIDMRQEDGIKAIDEAVGKMTLNFDRHVRGYNLDDNLKYSNATNKTGDSATSKVISSCIRIPPHCSQQRKGYLEDRRPPSNCDPYMVTERIVRTCILNERS